MRLAIRLLILIAVVAAGQWSAGVGSYSPTLSAAAQSEPAPKVLNVRRDGKRLLVSGEDFRTGAVIFVNGERQKTRNDDDSPDALLIAKKAGKGLAADAVISIEVKNADGMKSDPFPFFNGVTLTQENVGKPVHLSVGQRVLVSVKLAYYNFTTTVQDDAILKLVTGPALQPAAQGLYEAQRRGQTQLAVTADPKCRDLEKTCGMPSYHYVFDIVVD